MTIQVSRTAEWNKVNEKTMDGRAMMDADKSVYYCSCRLLIACVGDVTSLQYTVGTRTTTVARRRRHRQELTINANTAPLGSCYITKSLGPHTPCSLSLSLSLSL